jgi:hypothetical protein
MASRRRSGRTIRRKGMRGDAQLGGSSRQSTADIRQKTASAHRSSTVMLCAVAGCSSPMAPEDRSRST